MKRFILFFLVLLVCTYSHAYKLEFQSCYIGKDVILDHKNGECYCDWYPEHRKCPEIKTVVIDYDSNEFVIEGKKYTFDTPPMEWQIVRFKHNVCRFECFDEAYHKVYIYIYKYDDKNYLRLRVLDIDAQSAEIYNIK